MEQPNPTGTSSSCPTAEQPWVEKRQYFRHPANIAIDVWPLTVRDVKQQRIQNVSLGGLAFDSCTAYPPASFIGLRIALAGIPFEITARVRWCRPRKQGFEIGVEFLDQNDAFKVRMVEQMCRIEQYRSEQRDQGRELSSDEAAQEWINRYAAHFPALSLPA